MSHNEKEQRVAAVNYNEWKKMMAKRIPDSEFYLFHYRKPNQGLGAFIGTRLVMRVGKQILVAVAHKHPDLENAFNASLGRGFCMQRINDFANLMTIDGINWTTRMALFLRIGNAFDRQGHYYAEELTRREKKFLAKVDERSTTIIEEPCEESQVS